MQRWWVQGDFELRGGEPGALVFKAWDVDSMFCRHSAAMVDVINQKNKAELAGLSIGNQMDAEPEEDRVERKKDTNITYLLPRWLRRV